VDPTRNVLDLVFASNARQDDLRELTNSLYEEKISRLEVVSTLRAEHAREIREIETKRLDSIRQVDVLQAGTTAQQLLTAVQTLATQTAVRDEGTNKRIAALEQSLAKGEGKAALADPALDKLLLRVEDLIKADNRTTGKDAGISWVGALVVGGFTVVSTLLAVWAVMK